MLMTGSAAEGCEQFFAAIRFLGVGHEIFLFGWNGRVGEMEKSGWRNLLFGQSRSLIGNPQLARAVVIEIADADRMHARREVNRAAFFDGGMMPIIIDDELVIEIKA